jgi:hypothetical protein
MKDDVEDLVDAAVDVADTTRPSRKAPASRRWAYWLDLVALCLAVIGTFIS